MSDPAAEPTGIPEFTRRHALTAGFALCALVRPARPRVDRRVSVVRAQDYGIELTDLIRRILVDHRVAVAGKTVLLKPNLVEFNPDAPINTNPVFVGAVAAAFRAQGASRVTIAEGPGHRRTTMDMAEAAGYFESVPGFEKNFVDLNLDDISPVTLRGPFSRLSKLYLPNSVLRSDLIVSLPKMKTHHWAGATLSMKNLFGVVPGGVYGWPKNILHWNGIHESIADLNQLFPRQFCIVDGIQGMEGNGPILGTPKSAGVIVAGDHPPSVDATCSRIMGIDPSRLEYLQLVGKRTGWHLADICQTGETIRSVYNPFTLIPEHRSLRIESLESI